MSRCRLAVLFLTIITLVVCETLLPARVWAASPPATPENLAVLVIIIDFADEPRPTDLRYKDGVDQFVPLTVSNAQDVFFDNATSTAARFLEMSNGLMTITGDAIDVALALDIADAELDDWRLAADAEAATQGYPIANYDRVAYLLPNGFKNQIGVGGAIGTYCWVTGINTGNAYLMEYVYNHELGHTLDLAHANAIDAGGSISTTGDQTDFMGLAEAIHTAAFNKYNKGWLDGARNADHPVDGSLVYDIYPFAGASAQLQVVYVDSHGSRPELGAPYDTLVSYRKPINFDDDISLVATDPYGTSLRDTVHIHHALKSGSKESYLDRALGAGGSYDSCGLAISVNSINPVRARVQITQSAYNPVAPQVQVLPQGATAVEAGSTVFYDVDVTNFDAGTAACEAFYDQEIVLPGVGWTAGWVSAGQEVAVGVGQNATFENFTVHAPVGESPGMYHVGLKLTNNGGGGAPVETTVMIPYEVLSPLDTEPPIAPSNLVATEYPGVFVVLTWTASTDNVGVHTYGVLHNSVLLPDGGATPAYADFPAPTGGYVQGATNGYVVYAIDAAGNVSSPSNWAFVGSDLVAPSTPTGLSEVILSDRVVLDWDDSTDDIGIADYDVHRDGQWVATTTATQWEDDTVLGGYSYIYTVFARDGYGNVSGESAPLMVNTPASSPPAVPSFSPSGALLLASFLVFTGLRLRASGSRQDL